MAEPSRIDPSAPVDPPAAVAAVEAEPRGRFERLFGSRQFFRLWLSQVCSSLGDWIGLIAITALAARVGGRGGGAGAAIGLVLSARLIPGFFLGSVAGVVIDRWDRRRLMVTCDVGRAAVLAFLPFVTTVWGLFVASLVIEVMTIAWSSAKEASVPNIVRKDFLPTANSLSLVAAYGTFPLGGALFALLATGAAWLGHWEALHVLKVSQERLGFWFDTVTFLVSAAVVSTLTLPRPRRDASGASGKIDLGRTLREMAEGWRFIGTSPKVRAVIFGLATGLVGGGMVVPLGTLFASDVLHAGTQGYGLFVTAMGTGVAVGVIAVSVVQKRLPKERVFVGALFASGGALIAAATMGHLGMASVFVAILGVAAGAVYVLGFTILQTNVDDELRGRIFATLYALIRFCLLLALTAAPIISDVLDRVSNHAVDGRVSAGSFHLTVPGVRLTLWLGGLIILGAGVVAQRSLRRPSPSPSPS